jgi:hypothetical protein
MILWDLHDESLAFPGEGSSLPHAGVVRIHSRLSITFITILLGFVDIDLEFT